MAGKGFFAGSSIVAKAPLRTLPQCGACGLFKHCKNPKARPLGSGARRVLFVGEAPNRSDDIHGDVFSGSTGERIGRALKRHGLDLEEDCWRTTAVTCYPKRGRQPTNAEVLYCRPNLTRAIGELNPDIIIPIGTSAVQGVLGPVFGDVGHVARWAGWRIPSHALNAWVCPTWHPHHLEKEGDMVLERQFDDHIAAALALNGVPWPDGVPKWGDNVRQVMDPHKAARWLRKAATRKTGAVAWDYETNMLKPDDPDARIVSCSVAWGRRGPEQCIAYPWHGEAITATQELIRSPIPKIASNLKFEDRWTRKEFGHRVRAWVWDTMLAAHVGDNRPGITSVKFQAFVRFGVPVWNDKTEPFLKTKGDDKVNAILRDISISDLLHYNGMDSWMEFMVAVDQIKELGCELPWPV